MGKVYQLIKANRAQFPARVLCETLGVSHSGYYDWAKRTPSRRAITNCQLIEQIMTIYRTSDFTYGRPRITVELADLGVRVNHKRVGRLMREAGIKGVSRRRGFVITTHRNKRDRPASDLVQRHFKAASINQLWVADMTYIPTWAGFLYLAVVIDVFSRKVVGWSFGEHMTANLVINALNMALITRKPGKVIHHSDQGSQGGFNRSSQH
ncbi:integrase-like protein [Nitrosomonas oligotropha]|uniref:Integrase-like protein n=2 Tax=Nitrosomonas oligotropha TaxID=42354 RepID=A0A2T5HKH2_9PROT|nr:IS3 family transposase [Nitrosomonas oligotropha]PTQ72073.1 integrase-like protein [Nitrosomonas oligotropha]